MDVRQRGRRLTIAFLDVQYSPAGARAACLVADSWASEAPAATYCASIEAVQAYEPGAFYRRELPCLLAVLGLLPGAADVLVVDGYVWLSDANKPGLGYHLFGAVGRSSPVVGVAKTAFHGVESNPLVVPVRRGGSSRPLFVTAVGLEPEAAAGFVRSMAGQHRIPTLLAATDRLARRGSI